MTHVFTSSKVSDLSTLVHLNTCVATLAPIEPTTVPPASSLVPMGPLGTPPLLPADLIARLVLVILQVYVHLVDLMAL